MWRKGEARVFVVSDVALRAGPGPWPYADRHAADIAAHWQRRVADNPYFFNGAVHLLADYALDAERRLSARLLPTDFKSFLYWREAGWPDASVMDAFGSALIFSSDGALLLGRQRSGHLNGGLCYPPGGFIDVRDIEADGSIDIEASVRREIAEELGLGTADLRRSAGYVVTLSGPVLSIGVPYRSGLTAAELARRIGRHIAADPESELESVTLVSPGDATSQLSMPDYARALVDQLARLKTLI